MSSVRRVVTFHFTLRDPQGRLLDTSAGGEPIAYLEGADMIIDGLDTALREVPAGTRTRVTVPAAQGYGEHDPAQVRAVPRSALPVDGELHVGDQFQTGTDRGAPVVTVAAIDGDQIMLDANHPLAGVDLDFEVEILGARPATATELQHGHVHGDDGHCA